jgi:hypothetical protein
MNECLSMVVFQVLTSRSLVGGYQRFGGPYRLHLHIQVYTASRPERSPLNLQRPEHVRSQKNGYVSIKRNFVIYSYQILVKVKLPLFLEHHSMKMYEGVHAFNLGNR